MKLTNAWRMDMDKWKQAIIDPELPLVVLLHDGPEGGKENPIEAQLAATLANEFHNITTVKAEDFWTEDVAIMSPHNKHNDLLREKLSHHTHPPIVETVDRFQGRERNCVIYSVCVSDPEFAQSEANFLLSPNRLNVAITRARSKLIILVHKNILNISVRDDDAINALRAFRNLIFSTSELGSITLEMQGENNQSRQLNIEMRGKAFEEDTLESIRELIQQIRVSPDKNIVKAKPDNNTFTRHLFEILAVIEECQKGLENPTYNVWLNTVEERLSKRNIRYCFDDFIQLYAMGEIFFISHNGYHQVRINYLEERPYPLNTQDANDVIRELLYANNKPMLYKQLQVKIIWVNEHREDILFQRLEHLEAIGDIQIGKTKKDGTPIQHKELYTIKLLNLSLFNQPVPAPNPPLEESDYTVLNAIEDREAAWINFGVVEQWHTKEDLLSLDPPKSFVEAAIPKLIAHGHLMVGGSTQPIYRTRMAEMARELRLIKQRFKYTKADDAPYLTRAMKVLLKDRSKPNRDQVLTTIFDNLRNVHTDPDVHLVCNKFEETFLRDDVWTANAQISGFQKRSWERIFAKWLGVESGRNVVLTADTGAGKTEATCIPIIMGAMVDHLKAKQTQEKLGCSAILIYPRIRLANNQAHRLTHYLQLLHNAGLPLLTIGLQTGTVPGYWPKDGKDLSTNHKNIWTRIDAKTFQFPFFKCPICDGDLHLKVNQGQRDGVDQLLCTNHKCGWHFDGWVGSKSGLYKSPPTLFLPTADSLHQWLQNVPNYKSLKFDTSYPGNIFGDLQFSPPKAILADEIHLYSMTMGSQFAYTLRRTLYRLQSNSTNNMPPLAIGMSATLSEPCILWSELTGRSRGDIHHVCPTANESEKTPVGREYYYFMQPEIESRGKDIAGASSTIQNVMCIAHNMRRRTGKQGGYRSVVFMDSLDKVKRLSMDFKDAEENHKLSQLRIPNGSNHCCNQPDSCSRFQKGECWYFASTDHAQWTSSGRYLPGKHLTVSQPISSQLKSNAEDIIFNSDIVFATSSLEVGFDDPDMMMVYQHYSPTNLASFVQRKGRGGRGSDDRPITGVTLSSYSPTDTWYFRYPERMIESTSFEVPINTRNYFIQRGQVIAFMFDLIAQQIGKRNKSAHKNTCFKNSSGFSQAIRTVFGSKIFTTLGYNNVEDLWTWVQNDYPELESFYANSTSRWRDTIDETCTFLADPISLPDLKINVHSQTDLQGYKRSVQEDIAFAFSELSPGKISYRWGKFGIAHWNPYQGQFAPLFAPGTQYKRENFDPKKKASLPKVITQLFPKGQLPTSILRPRIIAAYPAGQKNHKTVWESHYKYQKGSVLPQSKHTNGVLDKSNSSLLGTLLLEQDLSRALPYTLGKTTKYLQAPIEVYRSSLQSPTITGLRAIKAFWGADVQLLVSHNKKRTTQYERVTFSDEQRQSPTLYGYMLDTEGVSLPVDPVLIEKFIKDYIANLSEEWRAHHRLTFFQYSLLQQVHVLRLNSYEVKMLTELISAGAKDPVLRETLTELLLKRTEWKRQEWKPLLKSIFNFRLNASGTISERRIESLLEKIDTECPDSVLKVLHTAITRIANDKELETYLTSCLLHSWAIRFKDLVTKHGHGDARRLMLHVKLPIAYDSSDYKLSVVELGSYGDGTVRTFESNLSEAFTEWNNDGILICQNARTDRALETLINMTPRPNSDNMNIKSAHFRRMFVRSLNLNPKTDLDIIQLCIRLISQSIEIQGDNIQYLELFEEVYQFKNQLIQTSKRLPNNQELISLLMNNVRQKRTATAVLQKIYAHYQALQANNPLSTMDESTSPERRLMNQIYQVSGTLCLDGCQGCLHLGSDIVSVHSSHLMTSRRLLQHFWTFQQQDPSRQSKSKPQTHSEPTTVHTSKMKSQDHTTAKSDSMDPKTFHNLFDGPYLSLMTNIQRTSENPKFELSFEPGTDVLGNISINDTLLKDVVIGSYLVKLRINNQVLFLIPEDQSNSAVVQTVLQSQGEVMLISPRDKIEDILDYVENIL